MATSNLELPGLLRGPKGSYRELLRGGCAAARSRSCTTPPSCHFWPMRCPCRPHPDRGHPLPADVGRVGESSDWGLLICGQSTGFVPQVVDGERRAYLLTAAQLLSLAVRGRHLNEVLRDRTRRVRIQPLSPVPRPALSGVGDRSLSRAVSVER